MIDHAAIEVLIRTSTIPVCDALQAMLDEVDYLTDRLMNLSSDDLRFRLYHCEQECLRRLDRIDALSMEIAKLRAGVTP